MEPEPSLRGNKWEPLLQRELLSLVSEGFLPPHTGCWASPRAAWEGGAGSSKMYKKEKSVTQGTLPASGSSTFLLHSTKFLNLSHPGKEERGLS